MPKDPIRDTMAANATLEMTMAATGPSELLAKAGLALGWRDSRRHLSTKRRTRN